MTDDVVAMLRSMQIELEARFESLMQELSKVQQQLRFLEAAIIEQKIAHRTTAPKKERT
jgi:hypothetical protein